MLASFKLRPHDAHVRVVLAESPEGGAFEGPGVDLRGPSAQEVFELCEPVFSWLLVHAPRATVRSVSFDMRSRRVLATLDVPGSDKPAVLRVEGEESAELFAAARAALPRMLALSALALARRGGPSP